MALLEEELRWQPLPLARGWRWLPYVNQDIVVPAKGRVVLWDRSASGWLYYFFIALDNPDALLCLDLHADGTVEIRVSPRKLLRYGAVGTNPGVISLYRYSDSERVYAVGYAPLGGLGVPFRGRIRGWVENPTSEPVRIELVEAWMITVG